MKSFNEKWADFLEKHPNTFNSKSDRALALMGYTWAVEAAAAGADLHQLAVEALETANATVS